RGGPDGLSAPVTIDTPTFDPFSQARVVSAGDVNEDGYGDLIVGGFTAALYLGGPNGVDPYPALRLPNTAFAGVEEDAGLPFVGADFDGDGHVDAVISDSKGNFPGSTIYLGDGHTLVPTAVRPTFLPFGSLAGDVNGDGLGDVAGYTIQIGGP